MMNKHDLPSNGDLRSSQRLLALDIRARKAGFVVFEGPTKLVDWGVRTYSRRGDNLRERAGGKIEFLLNLHSPDLLVVRRRSGPVRGDEDAVRIVIGRVRLEARRRSIGLTIVSAARVQSFFVQRYGCKTKYQIASLLAERFRELYWKLPAKRRPWESENHSMTIFDATAVAMAFGWGVSLQQRDGRSE